MCALITTNTDLQFVHVVLDLFAIFFFYEDTLLRRAISCAARCRCASMADFAESGARRATGGRMGVLWDLVTPWGEGRFLGYAAGRECLVVDEVSFISTRGRDRDPGSLVIGDDVLHAGGEEEEEGKEQT